MTKKKRPVYKDKPRFTLIAKYELAAKMRYSVGLVKMVKDLGVAMNEMTKI